MREKYESLSLATLKDLAKARGLKGISTLRKPEHASFPTFFGTTSRK